MSTFKSRVQRGGSTLVVILLIFIIAAVAGGYYLWPRFESGAPAVTLSPDSDALGLAPLEVAVTDGGSGLKSIAIMLSSAGKEQTLVSEDYAQPVSEKKIVVDVKSKLAGLKEGPATVRVIARDASWWNLFKGNETVLQKDFTVDMTPPMLELIADDRYVNFGGVGVIVYKASADTAKSGIRIGDYFFPGYQGSIKDHPDHYLALFAHPYNVAADVKAVLVATDKAGNSREMSLVYELKNVNYRKSTIAISDAFLQNKVAPLLKDAAARQGSAPQVFVRVNKDLRKENEDKITEVTRQGTPTILWKGAFSQLSNSKVEANFADTRTYTYNNEAIDTAHHLGYDLSVTKQYPVEAANSGKVAFAGDLGIYGNTVMLDHGLGLFTLYGHLSAIDVKVGDAVQQKQILGKTGETGLAAGDHLHYGVYLNGLAILPVEWWDQKWINDNIEPKLAGHTGDAIAEAQQPARFRGSQAKTKASPSKAPRKAEQKRQR